MKPKKNKQQNSSRRNFIRSSALAGAGFMIVPRHVLGRGYTAPSDKLNLAAIGAGGKGTSDIRNAWNKGKENVVALCDVDENRAGESIKKFHNAKLYKDFRVMLDEMGSEIDAVTISAPDHIHGVAAMAAMQAGIHVYVQTPLTHNIYETRMLTEGAKKYQIVSQMGNQGASHPGQVQMMEWFNKGLIGTVHSVYVWTDKPVNKTATAALGEMGCHLMDPPFRVLGLGNPTEVECSTGQEAKKGRVFKRFQQEDSFSSYVKIKFPASAKNKSEVSIVWSDGGIRPTYPNLIPADQESPENTHGVIMVGEKGLMTCGLYGSDPKVYLPDGEILTMPEGYSGGNAYTHMPEYGHHYAWTKAVKAGFNSPEHKALRSSFDYAGPLNEAVLLGNLAIKSSLLNSKGKGGKRDYYARNTFKWDSKNMKVTNFAKANQFVGRNSWQLT